MVNHGSPLASMRFFRVRTATFRVLFVLVIVSRDRRRIVHVNLTAHPNAEWTARQLRETWPEEHDLVDQAAERFRGLRATICVLQRRRRARACLPVEVGHAGMQEDPSFHESCALIYNAPSS
jgi:hypothetical protein